MTKIKKTDHFYLIDGSGYIFRAYYALPPLTRKSDGLPTGAVNGFCNMLFKLLEDSKSDDNKDYFFDAHVEEFEYRDTKNPPEFFHLKTTLNSNCSKFYKK